MARGEFVIRWDSPGQPLGECLETMERVRLHHYLVSRIKGGS